MSGAIKPWLLTGASLIAAAVGVDAGPAFAQAAPTNYTSYTRYDALGRVTGTIAPDPDGVSPFTFIAVRNTFDAAGNLTKVEKGVLNAWQAEIVAPASWSASAFAIDTTIEATFDAMGHKLTERVRGSDLAAVSFTQYSYSPAGSLECTAGRMNLAATPPVSACTLGTPATINGATANDRITRNIYNDPTQIEKIQQGVGTASARDYVSYTYTLNGKQASVTDARGLKASYVYDGFDRLKEWHFPDPSFAQTASATDYEAYTYDANGNMLERHLRDGATITYTYDALNRVTLKTVPERADLDPIHTRDVYYRYDLRGLVTDARFGSATGKGMGYDYDGFGRLISSTENWVSTVRTLTYLYDAHGNRTRLTFPDATNFVSYEYDWLDRPTAVKRNGTATTVGYTYDATGQRTGMTGGIATGYLYDSAGRLQTLTNTPAAAPTHVNQYTFAYNQVGQIVSLARSNDLFAWTAHAPFERDYAVNGLNQYTHAGGASFCYDAKGNLIADGASVYRYDIENRLIEKRAQGTGNTNCAALSYAGAVQASLRYDVSGRLYAIAGPSGPGAQETRLFYDGDALIGEYSDTGSLIRRHAHGPDGKADDPLATYEGTGFDGASERLLRSDYQGSIVLATDASGSTVHGVNRYDEYGIPQAGNIGRFQYTGQAWLPELGMYYYKARIYSPTLGRFLQTDPIGYKDQLNLYAYVGNDPVNRSDPTGLKGGTALDGCDPQASRVSMACGGTISANETTLLKSERISATDSQGKANAGALGNLINSYSSEAMKLTEQSDFTREHAVTASLDKKENQYVISLFSGPKVGLFERGRLDLVPTGRQLLYMAHTHTGLASPTGSGNPLNMVIALSQGRKAITIGASPDDESSASSWRSIYPGARFMVFFQSLHSDSRAWIARSY